MWIEFWGAFPSCPTLNILSTLLWDPPTLTEDDVCFYPTPAIWHGSWTSSSKFGATFSFSWCHYYSKEQLGQVENMFDIWFCSSELHLLELSSNTLSWAPGYTAGHAAVIQISLSCSQRWFGSLDFPRASLQSPGPQREGVCASQERASNHKEAFLRARWKKRQKTWAFYFLTYWRHLCKGPSTVCPSCIHRQRLKGPIQSADLQSTGCTSSLSISHAWSIFQESGRLQGEAPDRGSHSFSSSCPGPKVHQHSDSAQCYITLLPPGIAQT